MRILHLFTRDLRVHDHPALAEAAREGDEVVPLFVLDPRLLDRSANRTAFLLESLEDLDRSLAQRGGALVIRSGDPVRVTRELAREIGCDAVTVTADVSRYAKDRERGLAGALEEVGIELRTFSGHGVVDPGEVVPEGKDVYKVFTPYYRAWSQVPRREPQPAPTRISLPDRLYLGHRPERLERNPEALDLPPGGERRGRRRMTAFLRDEAAHYEEARNDLAADETSRLSPYLRFGCISANELVHRAEQIEGAEGFVRQVAWRDFYMQLLDHDPELAWRDMRPRKDPDPPAVDLGEALDAWCEGRTGIPLVDAGMRQLLREGWMHNRARLVAGSFLTRRLGVRWQEGARHFDRLLVDGDPSNNSGGWQWVAGTGTDTRSSRNFNPVRQGLRYDPDGAYVRRYVRELVSVPTSRVHAPWEDAALLSSTGYPAPILPVPVPSSGSG